MVRSLGLLIGSIAFLATAVLFYALSTGGILFGGASRPSDLGVYAVTVVLLGFSLGCFLLRRARLAAQAGP